MLHYDLVGTIAIIVSIIFLVFLWIMFITAIMAAIVVTIMYFVRLFSPKTVIQERKPLVHKGTFEEEKLVRQLEQFLKREKVNGVVLKNLYVPKNSQENTEIDAVMITPKGICVFESKDYSGWIYGSDTEKYWGEVLNRHRYPFYNPIMQNQKRMDGLSRCVCETQMYNLVAMSDRCRLQRIEYNGADASVFFSKDICNAVHRLYQNTDYMMREEQYNAVKSRLAELVD